MRSSFPKSTRFGMSESEGGELLPAKVGVANPRQANLFLDIEAASLEKPCLISLGLVDVAGEHRFHAELRDTWMPSRCSE